MENRHSSFILKVFFPACLGFVLFVTALFCAANCQAASITLAWDQSPDPVTRYTVFYGTESVRNHSSTPMPAGINLTLTIPIPTPGTYYFAIKAYYYNNESDFSNELICKIDDTGVTTISSTSTTSTATSTLPTTSSASSTPTTSPATSSLPNSSSTSSAPAAFTTTSIIPTSTSSLPNTSSTIPGSTTSTTADTDTTKKFVLGGKGAGAIAGETSDQTALTETEPTFTEQGAIAVFSNSDITAQLSVAWDDYNALNGEARIATGDIDGDGKKEVIIGLGPVEGNSEIPGGKFQILEDDFTSLGWGQIDWPEYNALNGETWPACGDIDGDGVDEILIGLGIGGVGRVEIFKVRKGKAVHVAWIKVDWEDYCIQGGGVRPACGNINLDRRDEIILGLYPPNDLFLPEGKFEVLDGSTKHLAWGVVDWPEYNALNGETRPACGDINRTMRDEILLGLGTGSGGKIPVYSYNLGKIMLKTWLKAGTPVYSSENGETRVACGDIDGDGIDEILIGFGQGGQGMMELHDDALHDFSILSSLQMPDENYNIAFGGTYPAIQDAKNKYSRIMNLFLKSLSNKRPKEK
jgi:hypothetical protein